MEKLRFLLLFNFLLFPCISFANPTEASVCGNGVWEEDEECDDGNDFSSDGCNTLCKTCTPEQSLCDGMTQGCDPEVRTDCSEENTQWEGAGLMDCCGEVCGYCVQSPSDEDCEHDAVQACTIEGVEGVCAEGSQTCSHGVWGQADVNVNDVDVTVEVAVDVDAGCCEDGGDCDEEEATAAADATDTGDDATSDSSGNLLDSSLLGEAYYSPSTEAKAAGGAACSLNPHAKNSPYQATLILLLPLISLIPFRLQKKGY